MNTLSKKKRKRPVKNLSEAERLSWLRAVREMSRMARVNRQYEAGRFGGRPSREASFGDLVEAGGTPIEDFWSRKDNGSV
jgi:hypothetical protein